MEGCCIARYGHHHGPITSYYNPYDGSKMDRIMLRFRPIAPKPATGGPTPTTTTTSTTTTTATKDSRKGRKRNTSTVTGSGGGISDCKKRKKSKSSEGFKVTLPLLPETPDLSPRKGNNNKQVGQTKSEPMWLCFGPSDQNNQTVVSSTVIVQGVTDTWLEGHSLGSTDEERKRRLDEDTCPGFISDAWNRVSWTNKAYRRMVTGEDDTWEKMVMVNLGMREKVELPPVNLFPAFTCRVKVLYHGNNNKGEGMINGHPLTVPCDAWRMDGGGFAWRLDIKAALSLGR